MRRIGWALRRHERPVVEETFPKAKRYQAMKNRLFLFNLVLNFLFLFIFMAAGWSLSLKERLAPVWGGFGTLNALYFAAFSLLGFIICFPLELYEGFILEHRFGLSRQTLGAWLKDLFKKAVLSFVISLVVVEVVYWLLLKCPGTWWLWAALFWFFISIVLTRIAPKVFLPLFFKYAPLATGDLRAAVTDLLSRFKVRLKEVYVLDFSKKTVKANAMVSGLGATKQIFFSDTLVNEFSQKEVLAVLAHEMGHYLSQDTLKLSVASLGSALASSYAAYLCLGKLFPLAGLSASSDIAGLPLLLIVVATAGLALLPLQNGFSRFLETRADIFALKATKDPDSFISLMQRLGEKNYSDFSPSPFVEIFLYDHPPLAKRIKCARDFKC